MSHYLETFGNEVAILVLKKCETQCVTLKKILGNVAQNDKDIINDGLSLCELVRQELFKIIYPNLELEPDKNITITMDIKKSAKSALAVLTNAVLEELSEAALTVLSEAVPTLLAGAENFAKGAHDFEDFECRYKKACQFIAKNSNPQGEATTRVSRSLSESYDELTPVMQKEAEELEFLQSINANDGTKNNNKKKLVKKTENIDDIFIVNDNPPEPEEDDDLKVQKEKRKKERELKKEQKEHEKEVARLNKAEQEELAKQHKIKIDNEARENALFNDVVSLFDSSLLGNSLSEGTISNRTRVVVTLPRQESFDIFNKLVGTPPNDGPSLADELTGYNFGTPILLTQLKAVNNGGELVLEEDLTKSQATEEQQRFQEQPEQQEQLNVYVPDEHNEEGVELFDLPVAVNMPAGSSEHDELNNTQSSQQNEHSCFIGLLHDLDSSSDNNLSKKIIDEKLPHTNAQKEILIFQLKELQKAFDEIIKNKSQDYQVKRGTHCLHHNKGLNKHQLVHLSLLKDKAAEIGMKLVVEHGMSATDVIANAKDLFNFNRTSYRFFVKAQTRTEKNLFKAEAEVLAKKNKKSRFCCFSC